MKNILKMETGVVNIVPYGLAKVSESFFNAANNFNEKDNFLVHLFLYCASIEIGLKACILSKDNSYCNKLFVQYKIGHDLRNAIKKFTELFDDEIYFETKDLANIKKINKYFRSKGLEYFTIDVICSLANGGKDFPSPSELKVVGEKVNNFLKKNNYFNN